MAEKAYGDSHDALATLKRGVSHLLDEFYDKIGKHHHAVSGHVAEQLQPPANAGVTEIGFEASIELPGIDEKDLEVTVVDDRLVVKGEKKQEIEDKGRDYHRRERYFGAFERVFLLPTDLDPDKTRATYEGGVLNIVVPRKKGAKPAVKKIPIKSRR